MKKAWTAFFAVLILLVICVYVFGSFRAPEDLRAYPECLHCGMSRKTCNHTRMTVEYSDGTKRGECSLHCLLADMMEQPSRQPKKILAADYNDKKLLEAEKGWWVRYDNAIECQGSKVLLAFRSEKSADDFVKAFGGKKLSFDEALKASYLDINANKKPAGKAAGVQQRLY